MSDKLTLFERVNILEGRVQQLGVEDDYTNCMVTDKFKHIDLTLENIISSLDDIYGRLNILENMIFSNDKSYADIFFVLAEAHNALNKRISLLESRSYNEKI